MYLCRGQAARCRFYGLSDIGALWEVGKRVSALSTLLSRNRRMRVSFAGTLQMHKHLASTYVKYATAEAPMLLARARSSFHFTRLGFEA